jgi:membrane-associated protease RseP (regulator of RpoE activity)
VTADDAEGAPASSERPEPFRWKLNLVLFLATVLSVFFTGARYVDEALAPAGWREALHLLGTGWSFAVPLMAILLTHEFGHYIAARIHRVDASLPFFIPLPHFSPFGTMGAIISMRGRIRSRDALLDIGASGPLAGLVVAIPVLIYGLAHSRVGPAELHGVQEGQSLLYMGLKRLVLGPIPAGQDVFLGPTAFAGWTGLFITALNLIPIGQLDGGHIAYALFGLRQNRFARVLHLSLLGMFALNLIRFMIPVAQARAWEHAGQAFGNALPWLIWYILLRLIMRGGGQDHPPTEAGALSPVRRGIALFSLVLFVLLFMPTPMAQY